MTRLTKINEQEAEGKTKELLDVVAERLGMVPNIMKSMANSPAALAAYLNFSAALSEGQLSPKLGERISLAVSQKNGCNYCVSAHSALGKMTGLSCEEIMDARKGRATESKADAALRFASELTEKRGAVSDQDVKRIQEAGYTDGEITEIIALVALNVFTNYFNHVAATEVDFPPAPELK